MKRNPLRSRQENVILWQKIYEFVGKGNSNESWGLRNHMMRNLGESPSHSAVHVLIWIHSSKCQCPLRLSLFTCSSLNLPGKFKSLSSFLRMRFISFILETHSSTFSKANQTTIMFPPPFCWILQFWYSSTKRISTNYLLIRSSYLAFPLKIFI